MNSKNNTFSSSREHFYIFLFIAVIVTAAVIQFYIHASTRPTPSALGNTNEIMPSPAARLPKSPEIKVSPETVQTITLVDVAHKNAAGILTLIRDHATTTYQLSASLPDIVAAYEYGAWLVNEDENIFHALGRLEQDSTGKYFLETTLGKTDTPFHKLMVTLEFIHTTSTPGQIFLEAALP